MSSIANSLDIVKIIKHKPADMAGWFTKFDRFARHPSVWPYMLSSMAGIVIIKSLSVGASGTSTRSIARLHLDPSVFPPAYRSPFPHLCSCLSLSFSFVSPRPQMRPSRLPSTLTVTSSRRSTRPSTATTPTKCAVPRSIPLSLSLSLSLSTPSSWVALSDVM